jgi:hypothetical protein
VSLLLSHLSLLAPAQAWGCLPPLLLTGWTDLAGCWLPRPEWFLQQLALGMDGPEPVRFIDVMPGEGFPTRSRKESFGI